MCPTQNSLLNDDDDELCYKQEKAVVLRVFIMFISRKTEVAIAFNYPIILLFKRWNLQEAAAVVTEPALLMRSCFFFSCIVLSEGDKLPASNKFSDTVRVGFIKPWEEYSNTLLERDLCVFGGSKLSVEIPFFKLNQLSFFVLLVHKNFKIHNLFLFHLFPFVVFLAVCVLLFSV